MFSKILELGVAAPLLDVVDEGRAIDRRKDEIAAAHLDRSLGIARELREGGWGGRHQVTREPAREAHPLTVDIGAGILEELERFGILAEIDPDLLEDRLRVLLDQSQPLIAEEVDRGNVACDVTQVLDLAADRAPRAVPRARRPGDCFASSWFRRRLNLLPWLRIYRRLPVDAPFGKGWARGSRCTIGIATENGQTAPMSGART